MRVIIAGGGTGGHLFPGVAIAEEIQHRNPASEVLFVGTAKGIEARVLPKLGLPVEYIDASGLKTVGALGALKGLLKVPVGLAQSRAIIKRFAPDAVIGVGGYASGPVVLAAALSRKPTAILEQNSIPGLANKMLGRFVRRVFLAFDETKQYFDTDKILMTGNPIRRELRERLTDRVGPPASESVRVGPPNPDAHARARVAAVATGRADGLFRIFCFGGSLGAKALNAVMIDAAVVLRDAGIPVAIVHQTGQADAAATAARYKDANLQADVRDFIEDMAAEYDRADLVVSRAGATTVAELAMVGKPAILVPYPFAADDHQTVNARELEQEGAAVLLPQADLDGARLARTIRALAEQPERLQRMQSAMKALGRPDAAAAIVDWISEETGQT